MKVRQANEMKDAGANSINQWISDYPDPHPGNLTTPVLTEKQFEGNVYVRHGCANESLE